MYKGVERRKYKRVKKPFIVSFQVREHDGKKSGWDIVAVIDIGAGGMLFYYNKNLPIGTELDVKVNYSAEKEPLKCGGKIIRVMPTPTNFLYLTAVVFTEIEDSDRKSLNDTVEMFHAGEIKEGK